MYHIDLFLNKTIEDSNKKDVHTHKKSRYPETKAQQDLFRRKKIPYFFKHILSLSNIQ